MATHECVDCEGSSFYDSDPVPLEILLKEKCLDSPSSISVHRSEDKSSAETAPKAENGNLSRAQLRALARAEARAIAEAELKPSDETALSKKESEAMIRSYKPWFHSKFAKAAVALPRTLCVTDIQQIVAEAGKTPAKAKTNTKVSPNVATPKAKQVAVSATEESSSESETEKEEQTWVGCDDCGKWRRVPQGVEINVDERFVCSMLDSMSCDIEEEQWDEDDDWVEAEIEADSRQKQPSLDRKRKRDSVSDSDHHHQSHSDLGKDRRRTSAEAEERSKRPFQRKGSQELEPQSPEDITTGTTLYSPSGKTTNMSRLEAVVHVLGITKRPTHYDAITRQALRMGLIKFTGSQGTAGESMKAFLNKTIRENKSTTVINLGKGVYGLREWLSGGASLGKSKSDQLPGKHHAGRATAKDDGSTRQDHSEECDRVSSASPTGTSEILSKRSPKLSKVLLVGPSDSQLNTETRRGGIERMREKFGSLHDGPAEAKMSMLISPLSSQKEKLGISSLLN